MLLDLQPRPCEVNGISGCGGDQERVMNSTIIQCFTRLCKHRSSFVPPLSGLSTSCSVCGGVVWCGVVWCGHL